MIKIVAYWDDAQDTVPSDGLIEEWATEQVCTANYMSRLAGPERWYIPVASLSQVDALRVQVVRGNLSHDDLFFEYKGVEITCDEQGRLSDWPEGFADKRYNIVFELIEVQSIG